MATAKVEGKVVNVGDYVSFKSDFEQCGKITRIDGNRLTLYRPDEGFGGDYIGGQNTTVVMAENCWIE